MRFPPKIYFVDDMPDSISERNYARNSDCGNKVLTGIFFPKINTIYVLNAPKKKLVAFHEICHWIIDFFLLDGKLDVWFDKHFSVKQECNENMKRQLRTRQQRYRL